MIKINKQIRLEVPVKIITQATTDKRLNKYEIQKRPWEIWRSRIVSIKRIKIS